MRDFGDIQSPPLECTSVVAAIQFVCSLYQENKATSNINQLRHEIFTKEIKSGDRPSPTLDVLVFTCAERTIEHLFGSQHVCQY